MFSPEFLAELCPAKQNELKMVHYTAKWLSMVRKNKMFSMLMETLDLLDMKNI